MEEVSGPVIGIALILAAVFVPTRSFRALPAVCISNRRDDRSVHASLRVQRPDSESRARRAFTSS